MKRLLKCFLSPVDCVICKHNPKCPIYTDIYVVKAELKKLLKALQDAETVAKAILQRK